MEFPTARDGAVPKLTHCEHGAAIRGVVLGSEQGITVGTHRDNFLGETATGLHTVWKVTNESQLAEIHPPTRDARGRSLSLNPRSSQEMFVLRSKETGQPVASFTYDRDSFSIVDVNLAGQINGNLKVGRISETLASELGYASRLISDSLPVDNLRHREILALDENDMEAPLGLLGDLGLNLKPAYGGEGGSDIDAGNIGDSKTPVTVFVGGRYSNRHDELIITGPSTRLEHIKEDLEEPRVLDMTLASQSLKDSLHGELDVMILDRSESPTYPNLTAAGGLSFPNAVRFNLPNFKFTESVVLEPLVIHALGAYYVDGVVRVSPDMPLDVLQQIVKGTSGESKSDVSFKLDTTNASRDQRAALTSFGGTIVDNSEHPVFPNLTAVGELVVDRALSLEAPRLTDIETDLVANRLPEINVPSLVNAKNLYLHDVDSFNTPSLANGVQIH